MAGSSSQDLETLKNVPVNHVFDIFQGFTKTAVMMRTVQLDIYSKLDVARSTPVPVTQLAAELELPPQQLERLLNACVSLGLLERSEGGEAAYSNTPHAKAYLTRQSSLSIIPIIMNGEYIVPTFSKTLLQPGPPGGLEGGLPGGIGGGPPGLIPDASHFYAMLSSAPPMMTGFQLGMTAGVRTALPVLDQLDFSPYSSIVDLGGGTGYLAQYVKARNTGAKVTLAELPVVIQMAKTDPGNVGIEYAEADFFKPNTLPQDADLYILANLLHNWDDDKCGEILKNVRSALQGAGASVMILNKLLSHSKTQGPVLSDMIMLNMAGNGRERSEAEIQQLLQTHGFSVDKVVTSEMSPFYDAILASKV